ncbi:MAG: hypothetical protein HRF45_00295 [Fimbriimonadia bacterium]|jgi:uncharacterized membrane protein YfcA
MRQKVGTVTAALVIFGVLLCAVAAYYWFGQRKTAPDKEPSMISAMGKLQQLTPEQRKEIGRKAEEAAKQYGK